MKSTFNGSIANTELVVRLWYQIENNEQRTTGQNRTQNLSTMQPSSCTWLLS